MEIGQYIAIGTPLVLVSVWLGRLEGMVRASDKRHDEHDQKHAELRADIQYIRERIDRALNGRH